MATIELEKTEYENLLKKNVEVEKLQMDVVSKDEQIELLQKDVETLKTENKEYKDSKDEVEKLKADIEKSQTDALMAEATGFLDKLIEDKKRLPKFKDMDVNRYIELKKAGDENAFNLFKEDLESRGVNVHTDQMKSAEVAIQNLMKKDGISWMEAAQKLGTVSKDDAGQPGFIPNEEVN
jgi:hypothetical protein